MQHALWVGLLIGGLCLGVQAWALNSQGGVAPTHGQTTVLTLTLAQMAYLLPSGPNASRSSRRA